MFTNRVVWITGASSGIGEALAARFARENARVVLSARRQPELERVRQHCIDAGAAPENMLVLPLDVTDLPSLPVAADHVISHFGQID
ncbi:MAG: SDR family NAD(P)-dependent oxidoreductase, partial [Marinobacter sp.]